MTEADLEVIGQFQSEQSACSAPAAEKPGGLQGYWKLLLLLLMLAISVGIILSRDVLRQFAAYGYPGVFLVSLIGNATVILPAPSLAITFAMGSVLNPLFVGLAAGAGEALGELTGYIAGYSGQVVVEQYELYGRMCRWMKKYGLLPIFLLSALPAGLFDVAGITAGVLRVPVWQFLLVCWIGKTIKCTLFAYAGAGSVTFLNGWLVRAE